MLRETKLSLKQRNSTVILIYQQTLSKNNLSAKHIHLSTLIERMLKVSTDSFKRLCDDTAKLQLLYNVVV